MVLYAVYPGWVAALILFVLLTHEMGHYLSARLAGADPWWPFLMAVAIWVFAVTVVDDLPSWARGLCALAGPVAGLIAALSAAIFFSVLGCGLLVSCTAVAYELWSLTLGSDGRKYRQAKRSYHQA